MAYYSSSNCPGSGCTWKNQSAANTHMTYVSNVIKELNPDIINFCEIEGCDELNMLIDKTSSDYKPYLIKGTDTSTGQNVGILTKIDVNTDLQRNDGKYMYVATSVGINYSYDYGITWTLNNTTINIAPHTIS
mgnify:CR=1 FL=1